MSEPNARAADAAVIRAGFIPLTDCAPLLIASAKGFDREFGFTLELHREVSWANIRDKVDIGTFDCAHMLAPMPLASALGVARTTEPIIVPMALNLGGSAITVSNKLYAEMAALDPENTAAGGMAAAHALRKAIMHGLRTGSHPLTLGMVYPFSTHNYDLRYWLAAGGIDPDHDVNVVVTPPPLLAGSLAAGRIDGFCVGAPWGQVSVASGLGHMIATKGELWRGGPEKVLGVRQSWADQNPDLLTRLVCAISLAARWLDDPTNRIEAAGILSRADLIGVEAFLLARGLTGALERSPGANSPPDPDFIIFHRNDASFPWRSHAIWVMTQMIRWGQVREPFDLNAIAEHVYRPDIYRAAIAGIGLTSPAIDFKTEGVAVSSGAMESTATYGSFFGPETFDPRAAMRYLARLPFVSRAVDLDAYSALNN